MAKVIGGATMSIDGYVADVNGASRHSIPTFLAGRERLLERDDRRDRRGSHGPPNVRDGTNE